MDRLMSNSTERNYRGLEFFHNPQFDWMGKSKYFITISVILLVVGIGSIIAHRGLNYGIDFRGGTLVYVKFAQPPNVGALRNQLDRENLHQATLQSYGTSKDEIMIGLDLGKNNGQSLDAGRAAIVQALTHLYGGQVAGKSDLNNASAPIIADKLTTDDPLHLASKGAQAAENEYAQLAKGIEAFRTRQGLIGNFNELAAVSGVTGPVISDLQKQFYLSQFSVFNTQVVGPRVGANLRRQALYVVLAGLAAMLVYVWYRFELIFGVAAVIATFHDVLITLGIFSLLNKEISLTVIAAFLTLIGYSMNDTIVTFDRIRENLRMKTREKFRDLVNRSINQVLSRTILTSGLTFLAVLALYLFGGEVIRGFSLVLVIGVIIGTYSSFAIASPLVLYWEDRTRMAAMGAGGKASAPVAPPRPAQAKARKREPAGARR